MGAEALRQSFALAVQLHTGYQPSLGRELVDFGYDQAPPFLGDLPRLAPIHGHLALGDRARAEALYDALDGPTTWHAPRFLRLGMSVLRMGLAVRFHRVDDVVALLEVLEGYRGVHAGGSGGANAYYGPVELWLGTGQAALGRHDAALGDLRRALRAATDAGTRPFAVHAATETAEVLAGRGGPGDQAEAAALAEAWLPRARALSMAPWSERLAALRGTAAPRSGPLSAREVEVAALVARGLTNKAIAAELYLSERTAQNHVQHILIKLGVANRTQIAAWYHDR
jgi:DNA-binding CsgD family transcriptional regulator